VKSKSQEKMKLEKKPMLWDAARRRTEEDSAAVTGNVEPKLRA
jgi:hypothetical protein